MFRLSHGFLGALILALVIGAVGCDSKAKPNNGLKVPDIKPGNRGGGKSPVGKPPRR